MGKPENVLYKGDKIVVVIDDTVEGGQKVIHTTDVVRVENARLHKPNKAKKKRKRMNKAEILFSNSPVKSKLNLNH